MIKNQIQSNENKKINSYEIEKLKKNFPNYFDKDANFLIDKFKKMLIEEEIDIEKEGYELSFLGKNYAKLQTSLETETVVVPDLQHNLKDDNINSENMYIVGDNIDAIKHLLNSYSNKIKCIYIDPPYNTGSGDFVYSDNFKFTKENLAKSIGIEEDEAERILSLAGKSTHSAWMTFMYPRLMLARDLLTDDGVVFISIDDNEMTNLKLICDEIFGEENFIAQIIVQSNKRGQTYKDIAKTHEYILVYAKSSATKIAQLNGNGEGFSMQDNIGGFSERELRNRNPKFGKFNRPNLFYPIYVNSNEKDKNGYYPVSLEKDEHFSVEVLPLNSKGEESCWRWGKDRLIANSDKITMENNVVGKLKRTGEFGVYEKYRNPKVTSKTIWFDNELYSSNRGVWDEKEVIYEKGSVQLREIGLSDYFSFPKPLDLLKKCIQLGTGFNDDEIVLDFFSGSATTAHATMKLNSEDNGNRKYIMVQLPEGIDKDKAAYKAGYRTIDEIGRARIEKAAEKIKKETKADVDYGYKLYNLKKPEDKTLDKIIEFDPHENFIYDDMTELFDFNGVGGRETILYTWLNMDGYGLTSNPEKIKLYQYKADIYKDTLYIIDPGLTSQDAMELIKKIEKDEINLSRIVIYPYSVVFNVIHELKKNMKSLKNGKTISLIERY
ncbi:site-specific DNA-methyltransferase [Senegalia massiliensis]|uniref:site-specific DNA-methyltransferase n=1 Tax=Senegalia massiliensis TaxID=1720316 RepID=UPI00102F3652|nr:site-specific DNA-methyltransferase [Senegalia massiliensis]